jgi:hypothetical protein
MNVKNCIPQMGFIPSKNNLRFENEPWTAQVTWQGEFQVNSNDVSMGCFHGGISCYVGLYPMLTCHFMIIRSASASKAGSGAQREKIMYMLIRKNI